MRSPAATPAGTSLDAATGHLPRPVVDLLDVAAAWFLDLGFAGPDATLDVPLDGRPVRGVRLELPHGQVLRLQSMAFDGPGAEEVAASASVRARPWDPAFEAAFDPRRLFDADHPTGTVVQTAPARHPWLDVRFARPAVLTALRLRNGPEETPTSSRGLRVSVRSRWRRRVVHDQDARLAEWRRLVAVARTASGDGPDMAGLFEVLDLTVRAEYAKAHRRLGRQVREEAVRRAFRDAVNAALLPARGLEWTSHGPQRPFRSWSEAERVDYVRDSVEVVEALRSLTPNVSFGFGSVLATVRDRALIPHDDDLDLIVAFEPAEAATLADGLERIEGHLRALGFDVTGAFAAHRHVRRMGRKRVDVFVGLFEGESISWYPGPRGVLTKAMVFPPVERELLGVTCPVPAQPEAYLEAVYGPGWRTPDPFFSHAWNLGAYADIAGRAVAEPRA